MFPNKSLCYGALNNIPTSLAANKKNCGVRVLAGFMCPYRERLQYSKDTTSYKGTTKLGGLTINLGG